MENKVNLEQLSVPELVEKLDIAKIKQQDSLIAAIEDELNSRNNFGDNRKSAFGRSHYFWMLLVAFMIMPMLVDITLGTLAGVDIGFIKSGIGQTKIGPSGPIIYFNFLSVWYLTLPLYLFITYKRSLDTGLPKWCFLLFIIPPINLILLFWPSKDV